jgi:putative FmdB family regulatory protein
MPTYEYACLSCGHHIEVFQHFSDEPLTVCGVCGGPLRKVFHPAGILFKGSGFYATDSRSSRSGSGKGESGKTDSSKGDSGKSDSGKGDSGKSDSGSGSGSAETKKTSDGTSATKKEKSA